MRAQSASQSARAGYSKNLGWGSRNAITGGRLKQADLARINCKLSSFTQPMAQIRRNSAERTLIAKAQHDDGLRSGRLDHFHRSGYGEDGARRVAEMSCRLGYAFGP